jgi:hypothetical protein
MTFQFRKESIEEDLNTTFPSQGQGNPPLYYSLSDVVVPTYSINQVAEGSGLPANLQTAWDFSTGHANVSNATTTAINLPGFWQINLNITVQDGSGSQTGVVTINDGITSKEVWRYNVSTASVSGPDSVTSGIFVVFLRSGDSLDVQSTSTLCDIDIWYRQIATLTGTLVNPLGYSAA